MEEHFITPTDAEIANEAKHLGLKSRRDLQNLAGLSFFIAIPARLLMRTDLSAETKIIYAMIIGLTRVQGCCSRTNSYLSEISGIPERSIRRCLQTLAKRNLIKIEIEKNEAGTWRYINPITPDLMYDGWPKMVGGGGQNGQGGRPKWPGGAAKMATHTIEKESIEKENIELARAPNGASPPTNHQKKEPPQTPNGTLPARPLTDVRLIVRAWKIQSGADRDDPLWDKINFARCAAAAKNLLAVMGGDADAAMDCIQDVHEHLTKKDLSVTLETIVRHSFDWRAKNGNNVTAN